MGGAANIGTRADQARFGRVAVGDATVGDVAAYTGGLLRLRTASIAAIALLAALIGAPAAAAKPAAEVQPAWRTVFIDARGTNGWRLQVSALLQSGKKARQPIGFFTRGPHREEVSYSGAEGRVTAGGLIEGKAPGVGRIAVRFEQTSEQPVTFDPEAGCKAEGKSAVMKGIFRGTIELHGEGGYTTVQRSSAPGTIEVHPRTVCHRPKHPHLPATHDSGTEYLLAGRKEGDGSLTFDAFASGLKLPGGGSLAGFSATYAHRRGKLLVVATTRTVGEEGKANLSVTAPSGTPTEATVAPPAPFSGTATFKLESTTTASWTGDLSVEVPTLGTVNLAEPGFWAGACATDCTKTFPPGIKIGFQVLSRLP
jgi:hypothetical protein